MDKWVKLGELGSVISHTLINIITDISIFQSEKGDLLGTEDLLGLSATVTWTMCYFQSCSFPCGFTWPLLPIIVLVQEKLFCNFGAKQIIKIPSYGTLKKFLSNSSIYWWEKRAQRGLSKLLQFTKSVGG